MEDGRLETLNHFVSFKTGENSEQKKKEMKFGKKLAAETIEEWKIHYVNYKKLKHLIKKLGSISGDWDSNEENFIAELDRQLVHCSTFFQRKEAHVERRHQKLTAQIQELLNSSPNQDLIQSKMMETEYLMGECNELSKFSDLNATAFLKILKKHDKLEKGNLKETYLEKLKKESFFESCKLKEIIADLEAKHQILNEFKTKPAYLNTEFIQSLYTSYYSNDLEKFKEFLNTESKSTQDEKLLEQLLYKFVQAGNLPFSQALLDFHPDDIFFKDEYDRTLLHVSQGETIEYLLEKNKIDLNSVDVFGRTILYTFAERGDHIGLYSLLKREVDVNVPDNSHATPLFIAAKKGYFRCVELLLQANADKEQTNDSQKTPLHLAVLSKSNETVSLLLNYGAQINALDAKQQTPLHLATKYGYFETFQLLIISGAQIDLQDEEGCTPIHRAASKENPDFLRSLLNSIKPDEKERVVNIPDVVGCTALHIAAEENRSENVKILLENHAKKEARDETGWTPQVTAIYYGHLKLAELLSFKKDPNVTNGLSIHHNGDKSPMTKSFPTKLSNSDEEQDQNLEVLFCQVKFMIRTSVDIGQYVAIVGNRKALGSWSHVASVPMTPEEEISKEDCIWTATIRLPAGVRTQYRYIICEGSRLKKWENLPRHRSIQISHEARNVKKDDGHFGTDFSISKEESFVSSGWLESGAQIKIRLNPESVKMFNSVDSVSRMIISTVEPLKDAHRILLPLRVSEEFTLESLDLTKLANLQFIFYSSSMFLGKAVTHPSQLQKKRGTCTCPILSTKNLAVIGEISFQYLIITAFTHPNLSKMLIQSANSIFSQSIVIGHRGGGGKASSKKIGKFRRTHIQENTLLSFNTASTHVNFIEFDVQLSQDHVPIIFHDFKIENDQQVKIPLNNLSLQQFKQLKTRDNTESLPPRKLRRTASTGDISEKRLREKEKSDEELGYGIRDSLPTLEECFKYISKKTGFNVELKYPLDEAIEKKGLLPFEGNFYVDSILRTVFDFAESRPIIFSSFSPDICIMARLKQPTYPVFFLTDSKEGVHSDARCSSLQQAVEFAKSNNLTGIVSHCGPLLKAPELIGYIKKTGLFLFTYGDLNNDPKNVELQEKLGVDAIILDHVTHISKVFNKDRSPQLELNQP